MEVIVNNKNKRAVLTGTEDNITCSILEKKSNVYVEIESKTFKDYKTASEYAKNKIKSNERAV